MESPLNAPQPAGASKRLWLSGLLATGLPTLLAFSMPPTPSLFNELLALFGWGVVLVMFGRATQVGFSCGRVDRSIPLALLLIAVAAWGPVGLGASTLSYALLTTLGLLVCWMLFRMGVMTKQHAGALTLMDGCMWGLLLAGLLNVPVSLVQVFFPGAVDGIVIPALRVAGRAVGTIRQPNHLAMLSAWGLVAVCHLAHKRKLPAWFAALAIVALCGNIALSGSRMGLLACLLMTVAAWFARSLDTTVRRLALSVAPIVCLEVAALAWASSGATALGAAARLGEGAAGPSSRMLLLQDSLRMIAARPWTGTGWGEFNFVWTLTPRDWQTVHHFTHAHNLPIHLIVELGLPLGILVIILLALGLIRACRFRPSESTSVDHKSALSCALLMALFSQFEYPLWYAYFAFPTAFFLGLSAPADEAGVPRRQGNRHQPMVLAGLGVIMAGTLLLRDYLQVLQIFIPPNTPAPLSARIEEGQKAVIFKPYAEYAAVTSQATAVGPGDYLQAAHPSMDERLLINWAEYFHGRGDEERALFLMQRARVFQSPVVDEVVSRCRSGDWAGQRFPCGEPQRAFEAADFR